MKIKRSGLQPQNSLLEVVGLQMTLLPIPEAYLWLAPVEHGSIRKKVALLPILEACPWLAPVGHGSIRKKVGLTPSPAETHLN